jgi:hypothetical protein
MTVVLLLLREKDHGDRALLEGNEKSFQTVSCSLKEEDNNLHTYYFVLFFFLNSLTLAIWKEEERALP